MSYPGVWFRRDGQEDTPANEVQDGDIHRRVRDLAPGFRLDVASPAGIVACRFKVAEQRSQRGTRQRDD